MAKILYVGGFALPDGNAASIRAFSIAVEIVKLGYSVDILGIHNCFKNLDVMEIEGGTAGITFFAKSKKKVWRKLSAFIDKKKYDGIICYNTHADLTQLLLMKCKRNGIALALDLTESVSFNIQKGWMHSVDNFIRLKYQYKKIQNHIFITRYIGRNYGGNNIVIPSLQYPIREATSALSISEEGPIEFVFCGTVNELTTKERIDNIVGAFSKVFGGNNRYRLTLIGVSEKEYVSAFGKVDDSNIVFKGRVEHKECVQFIRKCAFSLIIRDACEKNNAGFPTKLGESLYCGTVPIITDVSEISDYLEDGKDSFILHNAAQETVAECFRKIQGKDTDTINEMKQNAFRNSNLRGSNFSDKLAPFMERFLN